MRGYYPGYNQRTGGGIIFALFVLGVILTICLYFVKTRAQAAKAESARLEQLVEAEQNAVKILKAELAHLQSPSRLSAIAGSQMGMEKISVDQVKTLEDISELFPLREPGVQP